MKRWALPAVLVVVVGAALLVGCGRASSPGGQSPAPLTERASNPSTPERPGEQSFELSSRQDSNLAGVPAGITEEGTPYRGDPNATVTLVEFSDFQCPFCRRHFLQTQPTLDERYIAKGVVRHVFKHFPLSRIHPQAEPAAQAALCAGVQGKFWPMHDLLFQRQDEWAGQDDAATYFRRYAKELGLDMALYDACWQAQPFTDLIRRDVEEGQALGVTGTPTFFVNDWRIEGAQPLEAFVEVIERAARGERPTPTPTPSYADLHPFEPNPETPGRTYWGDAYIGAAKAPVVILEVSDLLCPYCRKHHLEVWPEFKARYVDTGQVRVVFKHLLGHQGSDVAAEAAECAGNQGQFFEYVDLLYKEADAWKALDSEAMKAAFVRYAAGLGLREDAFSACLENHEMREKVLNDHRTVLAANVTGTPTFIIIVGTTSLGRIPGFIPLAQWEEVMAQVQTWLETHGQN